MARPTKYNSELADGVVAMVRKGYTIKATASANGVSEASLRRWRSDYPDFNKSIIEATREQRNNVRHLSKIGVRTYTRKAEISPYYDQRPAIRPSATDATPAPTHWQGLPIRPLPLDNEPASPCLNPNSGRVEWRDKAGVLHSCPMHIWQAKHQPRYEPFIADFF